MSVPFTQQSTHGVSPKKEKKKARAGLEECSARDPCGYMVL